MRSRFTAFAVGDESYLLRSWHSTTRPDQVRFVPGQAWTRLEILATVKGAALDSEGHVEFRAHHARDGRAGSLHELSRFVREGGAWVYLAAVDADVS